MNAVTKSGTNTPTGSFSGYFRSDKFNAAGPVAGEVIFEVFNEFNRANFNLWTTNESSASYGRPEQDANVAFAPRMLQLGFRATF